VQQWGTAELATTKKTLGAGTCIYITRAMRPTPVAALEVILDLTPLHSIVKRTAWRTHLRLDQAGFRRKAYSVQASLPSDRSTHIPNIPTDEIIRKFSYPSGNLGY